jgi:hypothetical protein
MAPVKLDVTEIESFGVEISEGHIVKKSKKKKQTSTTGSSGC